jgi:N6-adenosine-specific RNA methylase IME4
MSRLKVQLGHGNYLRQSYEIMLTAVQGNDNRFDDRPRGRDSEIPDAIHELLENKHAQVCASNSSYGKSGEDGSRGATKSPRH